VRSPTRSAEELFRLQRIRIVVIGLPQILRDVITDIVADQPDMEVVGDLREDETPAMVEDLAGSFVAMRVGPSGELPDIGTSLLERRARGLRILGLSSEGRTGFLYELRPNLVAIGEVSPDRLLSVIRAAVPFDMSDLPMDRMTPRPPDARPNAGLTT
jgi:DNA-binding NarL/FixJ family response regulator